MNDSSESIGQNEANTVDSDPNRMRKKYRSERDKRLRSDGNNQYQNMEGRFAHFIDDPFAPKDFQRQPLTDQVDVAIIGGGFGGLLVAARLREVGVEGIRVIEKGSHSMSSRTLIQWS